MRVSLKYKVLIILVLSVIIGVALYYYGTKARQEQATGEALKDYSYIAREYALDAIYKSKEFPVEVELYPSAYTEAILERWKAISERYPELDYPESAIEARDWIEVHKAFEDTDLLKDVIRKMYKDATIAYEGLGGSYITLLDYIFYKKYEPSNMEDIVIDLGIEPPREEE
ncbi:hypothetical protein [Amphibacillus cookii]|uniref:hypothetical protein n=1 Tax=Amphibacillus cookii TaxID=767787 RepID=UPI00195B9761|nr:hypothetical protein [Amphibacillus cookii]MBM7539829.1 hypothetical protein [Amphibacillus cookii]